MDFFVLILTFNGMITRMNFLGLILSLKGLITGEDFLLMNIFDWIDIVSFFRLILSLYRYIRRVVILYSYIIWTDIIIILELILPLKWLITSVDFLLINVFDWLNILSFFRLKLCLYRYIRSVMILY